MLRAANDQEQLQSKAANAAMDRYAAGDASALPELYDALAPTLYHRILERTGSLALAADLLDATFVRLCHARGKFIRGADVTAWACRNADAVTSECLEKRREVALSVPARAPTAFEAVRALVAFERADR